MFPQCARGGTPRHCNVLALVLAALCLAVLPGAARAQTAGWTPRVETRVPNPSATLPSGELIVNGVVVMRLRTEMGGVLPEGRSLIAADRLRAAIAGGLKPGDIAADTETDKMNPRLKAAGQVIATATADEAKTANVSPATLVQNWADALRRALAIPGVGVSADRLIVPVGETRVLRISGAARGPFTVETATPAGTPRIVSGQADAAGGIVLRGLSVGRDTLTITREGATATVTVAVQLYAGRIDPVHPLSVTGTLVPAEMVTRYTLARALAAARTTPGATVRIEGTPPALPALSQGQTRTVEVPLEITGAEMIPVRGVARVVVTAQRLPPVRTSALLYSNNPERISRTGTLFVGRLAKGVGATRLLYHHQSALDRAVWFTVELINDSDAPVRVQVVGGGAGPVMDTVWVGYRAASLFFKDYLGDVGAILEIPKRSRVALKSVRLGPGLTISGLAQLRQISGDPLLLRVGTDIPGSGQIAELLPAPIEIADLVLSGHVYPEPRKQIAASYQAGGRWTFVSIGKIPIRGADTSQQLEGNYGVFYDISLTLENPTDRDATAQIAFEPSAGLAGGIFLIDGKAVEIPQAKMPTDITIARYSLPAGAKQTVLVRTLPLSGSAYPATLIIRPGPTPVAARPVVTDAVPSPATPVPVAFPPPAGAAPEPAPK